VQAGVAMKIAVIHSFYSAASASGENAVVSAQVAAMQRAGMDVGLISVSTDDLARRPLYAARTAIRVAMHSGESPLHQLRAMQPDVVHVHNVFPNYGTAWLQQWEGPVVTTLHNFRPVCAAGTLFRDGHPCTLCPDGSAANAVRHKCYRGSTVATLPLAIRTRHGVHGDPLLRRSDHTIVLSERARAMYDSFGLEGRVTVVPNFVPDPGAPRTPPTAGSWVFAGRLTPEKGIIELMRHWPADRRLHVYGDGPALADAQSIAPDSVHFHGLRHSGEVAQALAGASGLIFPSMWAEGSPISYIEALAAGRPVVSYSGNTAADDIEQSRAGVVFHDWTSLTEALDNCERNLDELGRNARLRFESVFSEDSWLKTIQNLYAELTG
jgi:glycosyltransferase involved in cell wall biosynthesis